jgi:hypothetical protein
MEYNPEKMPGKIAPPNSTAQSLFESAYGIQPLNSSGEEGGGFASPTQLQQFLEGLGVAHNSTTPPEILATLAQDKDWSVRKEEPGTLTFPLNFDNSSQQIQIRG